ncbi:MAG: THUMP domain-containing protein [Promethearchaeota archaeon CR_4]|nr:MAG: THUMP domain-containing protein [Candidatus Lokiarchaeota archaeon CR_4]
MQGYNLLISVPRRFERDARAEFWLLASALGDDTPFSKEIGISGLILCKTRFNPKDFVTKVIHFKEQNPHWRFLYLLKIVPLDRIVERDVNVIVEIFNNLIQEANINPDLRFKVEVKERESKKVKSEIIEKLANLLRNPVDLDNPDIILRVEFLGRYCGISILTPEQVLSLSEGVMIKV